MRQQVQRGRAAAALITRRRAEEGGRRGVGEGFQDDSDVCFSFFRQTSGEEIKETPRWHEPAARLATCHWPDQMPPARPKPATHGRHARPPTALKAKDSGGAAEVVPQCSGQTSWWRSSRAFNLGRSLFIERVSE